MAETAMQKRDRNRRKGGQGTMKFMHIADVHLGVVPDKGKPWSEQRSREIKDTFQRVLDIAGKEQIDLLLIAGDLFHFPPTMAMLKELDSRLEELEGVTTIIIAGNHDYRAAGSPIDRYEFQSDTVVLRSGRAEQIVLEDLETCVTGISYDRKEIREGIYDSLTPALPEEEYHKDYLQILLAHGGDAMHAPMNRDQLMHSGFDYIALGHIHKPEIIAPDLMINAGSLEPIDYTDTGARGYVWGEAWKQEGRWQVHTQWKEISCRQYMDLVVEVQPELTNYMLQRRVQEQIDASGAGHIYRVMLEGCRSSLFQADLNGLMNLYYIYEIVDHTHEAYDLEQLQAENPDNLLGRFIQAFDGQEDELHRKALEYGVKALLRCREYER